MKPIQVTTALIFSVTISLVIARTINPVGFALLGVVAMVVAGSMTEVEAFRLVDWHVLAILVSIWLIAGYFRKTGIPEYLGDAVLHWSKGNIALFVALIGTLAGFVSMFVDNVVVVLMFAPVIISVHKIYAFRATGPILFVGLCANCMGTALLLGDLPPQMLHRSILDADEPEGGRYQAALAAVEGPLIAAALARTGGNQLRAAELLGMNRNTLRERMRALGMKPRS